ncbi:MAG: excinuclease subunit UvrC [Actinomycetota bacterium]
MAFDWRPKTGDIPTSPGVYRYWDENQRVIYVGKAKNLRNRITSYFADVDSLHPRTVAMLETAQSIDWVSVNSEVEALQLEHSWINEYDPRFNVRFRDDKSYPWLAVSVNEKFPRVMVVRGDRRKGWKYFGPYIQAWQIRDTIDRLLRVFPVRTCSDANFKRAKASGRPCLLGYIDKCAAPCVGRLDETQHRELIDGFIDLINGESKTLLKRLNVEMQTASDALEFEKAARLRDDIAAVESVVQRSAVVLSQNAEADVIAVFDDELAASVQVFHVRQGRITGERGFVSDKSEDSSRGELLERFVSQLYEKSESIPAEILVSAEIENQLLLADWISEKRGKKVEIRVPQRGEKLEVMQLVQKNAESALALYRSRRGADIASRSQALEEIAEYLDLKNAPLRIECIDVSHFDGDNVVASLVVFEDGLPQKSAYRRFVIKHGRGNDDVGSIAEVVERRFKSEAQADTRKFAYPPQLLVIDGGAPQVNAASEVLQSLNQKIPVVGLAKRLEEVWLPDSSDPIIFPRSSEGLFMLQRVRDEAHRFAIAHQRQRGRKSLLASTLDDISGLGEVRKKSLLKAFGSLKKLKQATVEDIASVPGIGSVLAESIHSQLAALEPEISINMTTGEVVEGA